MTNATVRRKQGWKVAIVKLLSVAVVVFATYVTNAASEVVDGVTWYYKVSDSTAYITSGENRYIGGLVVPSTLGECKVASIGAWAFNWCTGLTSVKIPEGVVSIRDSAFYFCNGLTNVTISSSVTSIADGAFYGCSGLMSIEVDDNNPNYKTVNGMLLSKDGTKLIQGINNGSVTIPEGVTSISYGAFRDCSALTNVTISSGVANIGCMAFGWCNGLTSVIIPEGVKSLDGNAFWRCSSLTNVTISSSVTEIGSGVFGNCCSLMSVDVDVNNPNYKSVNGMLLSKDGTELIRSVIGMDTIPEGVTSIGDDAFSSRYDLLSITIHEGVSNIGYNAFCECSGLTMVTIPSSVTDIGSYAFSSCYDLWSITIPEGVRRIGGDAFAWSYNLECVDFEGAPPEGLLYAAINQDAAIRYNVAYEDEWLPVIEECGFTNAKSYEVLEDGKYTRAVDGIEWTFVIANGEASVGGGSWNDTAVSKDTEGEVTIPAELGGHRVTSIGDYAFYMCDDLTNVTISSSVTNIGYSVFIGCSSLMSIDVDEKNPNYISVQGLLLSKDGTELIQGVNGDVMIPEGVVSIGSYAFEYRDGLTSVTIPLSVTSIGRSAFSSCSGLMSIEVDVNNPNYKSVNGLLLSKDGTKLIQGVNGEVTIPEEVTIICDDAFCGCIGLTSVTIPEDVEYIGYSAFCDCSGLTSITIPEGVEYVETYAFSGCRGLASVTIPEGVKGVGYRVFQDCSKLTNATISSSVTSIDNEAFVWCESLMSIDVDINNPNYKSVNGLLLSKDGTELISGVNGEVTIPEGVTIICESAFIGCTGLSSVMIPSGVEYIGDYAFCQCHDLTSITIPESVMYTGYYAFVGVLASVDFEGAPPEGLVNAYIKKDAAVRYNVDYEEEWLPVIEACGFTNATAYRTVCRDGGPCTEIVDGIEWTFMVTNSKSVVTGVSKDIVGSVAIPSTLGERTVTKIADNAIGNCKALESITIPESVTDIGAEAFCGCSKLKDVYFEGNTIASIAGDAFAKCNWDLVVHVPSEWNGRSDTMFGHSIVRGGAADTQMVYITVTNVVVQYVLNSIQPEIAVPVSGDTGFVAVITEVKGSDAIGIPSEWKDNYPTFETKYGDDFCKALTKLSGKKDGAGDMFVWQDYVAGTDPTDPNDKFTASITMVEGVPVISYTPELTKDQKALRTYKTFGKKQLKDVDWTDLTGADGDGMKDYNFFKVSVEMK